MNYHAQTLTILHDKKSDLRGTVAAQIIARMQDEGNPVLTALDSLMSMAEQHSREWGRPIKEDPFASGYWLEAAVCLRGLISMDFGAPQENGAIEAVFWGAMRMAGFTEEDV